MSIHPNRLLWRIVDQVQRSAPGLALQNEAVSRIHGEVARGAASARFALVQAAPDRLAGGAGASLFHFWAHALREFLDEAGEAAQLEGVAGAALCQPMRPPAARETLAVLTAGARYTEAVRPAAAGSSGARARSASVLHSWEDAGALREAYRMLGGPCRVSLAAAGPRGWLAFFWAHAPLPVCRVLPAAASAPPPRRTL